MNTNVIRFHRLTDEFGCLTNFARYPIVLGGKRWPTNEHWFQANKFEEPVVQEAIRAAFSPRSAARLGHDRSSPVRPDWDTVRVEVMRQGMREKFKQHPEVRRRLLSTGESHLIEDSRRDYFWGVGADGSGQNMNGQLLMEIRKELRTRQVSWRGAGEEPSQGWVLFENAILAVLPPSQRWRRNEIAADLLMRLREQSGTPLRPGRFPIGDAYVEVADGYRPSDQTQAPDIAWVQGPAANACETHS